VPLFRIPFSFLSILLRVMRTFTASTAVTLSDRIQRKVVGVAHGTRHLCSYH
jgi:hypothetical protein